MVIADLRREYAAGSLRRADLHPDPLAQFGQWFNQAICGKAAAEANAMTLATADKSGRPAARIVLLKGVDARGFAFFSHYGGPKGLDLAENPQAALVFYWPDLERQVCVGGTVEKLAEEESAVYFRSRPRGSRLAAWVARQSQAVPDRKFLEDRLRQAEAEHPGDVPKPDYWGGYVLSPARIEFWQGRPNRLHDRFLYTKQADGSWQIERLSP